MIINAKKRLTAASKNSFIFLSSKNKWSDKELMEAIVEELEKGKEGDSMESVKNGIILGNSCFAMPDDGDYRVISIDKISKENTVYIVSKEFVKNCAKYLK